MVLILHASTVMKLAVCLFVCLFCLYQLYYSIKMNSVDSSALVWAGVFFGVGEFFLHCVLHFSSCVGLKWGAYPCLGKGMGWVERITGFKRNYLLCEVYTGC